jgi:hypothetical protein
MMAEDLSRMWENFSLADDEEEAVEVQATDFQEVTTWGRDCIIGKLVTDRYVSMEAVKNGLQRGWKSKGTQKFKVLGENLFIIEFEFEQDKKRVLEGGPWDFEGSLFLVEDYDDRTTPANIKFDRASFWIRMSQLPLGCMGREVGRKIGATVGVVEAVDTDARGVAWGEYLRVKISVDLSKPLARGRKINLEGTPKWIPFKYEKLPKFCFQCGVISHGPGGCMKRNEMKNQRDTNQFGPWLRAPSPPRRTERNQGDVPVKHGRAYSENTIPEKRSRRGADGKRREEERNHAKFFSGNGERRHARSFSGDGEDEVFRESNKSPLRRKGSGDHARSNPDEIQTEKERFPATVSQPVGFQWVQNRKEDLLGENGNKLGGVNEDESSSSKILTKQEKDKQDIIEKGRRPTKQQGSGQKLAENLGPTGSGEKRLSSGGVYRGPTIAEIEKNVTKEKTSGKGQTETEDEDTGKAMVTWKRKEREWLEETGKKNEDEGYGRKEILPKKGRRKVGECDLPNGSGMAAAEIQPRRPQ